MKNPMLVDEDCLVRMILGANELLTGLNHPNFQVRLRDALQDEGNARFEFLERDYTLLVGSLQTISGVVQVLADGLLNGDLELILGDKGEQHEL